MKKFILAVCVLVVLLFAGYYAYYRLGFYFLSGSDEPVTTFMKTDADTIYMERDGEYEPEEVQSDIASDIYGAYYDFLSGENVDFSGALWDLWNAVLFDIENLPGNEDALIKALAEQNAEQVAELAAGMRTPG